MALDIRISTGSSVPIYRQIADQVCRAAARGAVAAGKQLPSVRALAEFLVINPNTVARAYGDLMREGVVEARQGKGVFIARRRPIYTRAEKLRRLEAPLEALVNEAVLLDLDPAELRELVDKRLRQLDRTLSKGAGDE